MSRRELTLVVAALVLAGAAFGPDLYERSRPVTALALAEGGAWRVVEGHRLVIHRIARYCYSPGIGVIVGLDSQPSPRAFITASAIAAALGAEAQGRADRYITVTLEFQSGYHWPWQVPDLYTYAWHYNERQRRWDFFAYSPAAARPAALDLLVTRKRAA
jgi:hypothetical protein